MNSRFLFKQHSVSVEELSADSCPAEICIGNRTNASAKLHELLCESNLKEFSKIPSRVNH